MEFGISPYVGFTPCWMEAAKFLALLQSLAERLRRLPCLLIADEGVAHRGADILMAEELLDFPQIFST